MSKTKPFGPWQIWSDAPFFSETSFRETLDGGQAFRWKPIEDGYLEQIESATTEEARALLMLLPGVGRKIADCTLLFGMGRLESFPIDTWVQKILTRAYGLDCWKTEQLLDFARIHLGPAAGYAQQYLFAAAQQERSHPKEYAAYWNMKI